MGTFIVSLDCEGKWGMADHLQPYIQQHFTDAALAALYDDLVRLFASYDVPATFAYVMAFTLSPEERRAFPQLDGGAGRRPDPWMAHHWADLERGNQQGWFQPHALDAVKADGRHEIASHGFCHRPLGDGMISEAEAEAELDAAAAAAALKGVRLRTIIFPRNMVGHLGLLRRKGYIGYRELLRRPAGRLGRLARLGEEFNMWPATQAVVSPSPGELVRIPAGYFFNWRFGARRRVPAWVTVKRWTNLIDKAAATGSVAHLWLHPHNLITGPETRGTLEQVLRHAARLRDAGRIQIQTQERYCEQRIAEAA
jgi:peptidoglycan/xylan/chitin deacetylase (PgdA/CDA1 family)